MKVKITADSTCDLSEELIERYNIGIFPLSVILDGRARKDGIEVMPQDIYDAVSNGGKPGGTAAVNTTDYKERFTAFLETYDAVVHFTISSEMSACYQNACIAASELKNVYVIDSRSLSTGIGHLVLDAAELAISGVDGKIIAEEVMKRREKLDVSFVLDTLLYLRMGGRCSALSAMGANLLSLKPCIEVRNGIMGVGKKYRGTVERALVKYVQDRLSDPAEIDRRRLFITHSGGFDGETLDAIKAQALSLAPFDEVYITTAGCTVSSHCGPKTLGLLFYRK